MVEKLNQSVTSSDQGEPTIPLPSRFTPVKSWLQHELKQREIDPNLAEAIIEFAEADYYIEKGIGPADKHMERAVRRARSRVTTEEGIYEANQTALTLLDKYREAMKISGGKSVPVNMEAFLEKQKREAEERERKRKEQERRRLEAMRSKLTENFKKTMIFSDDELRRFNSNERVRPSQYPVYQNAERSFQKKMEQRTLKEGEYNDELAFQEAKNVNVNMGRVAEGIVGRAKKLLPDAPWDIILREVVQFKLKDRPRPYTGIGAIQHTIAPAIGTITARMGWQMYGSAEVMYMSGYHFMWLVKGALPGLTRRLNAIKQGRRQFVDEDAKAQALIKEEEKITLLSEFVTNIEQALQRHAQEELGNNYQYLVVLRSLMYMKYGQREGLGNHVIRLLRQGDLHGAFNSVRPRGRSRRN